MKLSGYFQSYYTLEEASKELNLILGKSVYTPEKLLQLALKYDLNHFFIKPEDWEFAGINAFIEAELLDISTLNDAVYGILFKDEEIPNHQDILAIFKAKELP